MDAKKAFYGKYRATVFDINDPRQCGRIRVKCPKVLGDNASNWALPCFPSGLFRLPRKGDLVWVEFEGGDRNEPIWTGVFYTPKQFYNTFGNLYASGNGGGTYLKGIVVHCSYRNIDVYTG